MGYKVDSSVTPRIDWSGQGGPDHRRGPVQPYFISEDDYYAGGGKNILEVPVTIDRKRLFFLPDKWFFYRWLRPTHMTTIEMKMLVRSFSRNFSSPVLNLMFHSMEPIPGKTPFVRTRLEQKLFLRRLENIIKYLRDKDFCCKTLGEIYHEKL